MRVRLTSTFCLVGLIERGTQLATHTEIRIADPQRIEHRDATPAKLVGKATVHPISPAVGTEEIKINAIYFEPGARFRPHSHPFDQILYYQYGTGVVAINGGDDVVVPEGQYVILPGNTVHMHGCTDDGPALQLSLMRDTQTTFDVKYPVGWERWRP
jgi:quercetin dioxygenase-like cupin family protein